MTQLFHNVKALLVDLSGTLHIDNYAITGSQEALKKIRNHGFKLKFVTNTSKENVDCLHNRLQNLNFEIFRDEIYSSLTASSQFLYSRGLRPHLMLSDSAKQDFVGLKTENPNAVLIGLSPHHFQYDEMTLAFRMLLGGAALIAINKARYFKRPDGLALGTGSFVAALEYASGTEATIVGKPSKNFFLGAATSLGVCPSQCVMIGDDYRDDVEGAINAGMGAILVRTGKYRAGDEEKISAPGCHVADDFAAAVDMLLSK